MSELLGVQIPHEAPCISFHKGSMKMDVHFEILFCVVDNECIQVRLLGEIQLVFLNSRLNEYNSPITQQSE